MTMYGAITMTGNLIFFARTTLIGHAMLMLAACGSGSGSGPTYSVGGKVAGLAGSGLELADSSGDLAAVLGNGFFTIATAVAPGAAYSVSVKAQPQNPEQTCVVTNGSGIMGDAPITSVSVTCTTIPFTVGGTVSGPAASGLVLQDNGGDNFSLSSPGTFTFATPLVPGAPYDVTVLTQPITPSQTCTVANGSGTMGGSNVSNISVTCTSNINDSIVNGAFIIVAYDDGGQVDELWTLTFDRAGNVGGTEVRNSAAAISTTAVSGTYAVGITSSPIPPFNALTPVMNSAVTISLAGAPVLTGYVSVDANTLLLSPLSSGQDPGIAVGIKQAQGTITNQNLSGTFAVAGYGGSAAVGSVATLSFDGAGNLSGTAIENNAGAISNAAVSGTYTVAANGSLTMTIAGAAPLTGGISADGNTLVLGQTTSGQAPAISVGIKQGQSNFTNADISGLYAVASYGNSGVTGSLGTFAFDGSAKLSGPLIQNTAGVIASGNSLMGTYSISAGGALVVSQTGGESLSGGVSADGMASVIGQTTAGQPAAIEFAVPIAPPTVSLVPAAIGLECLRSPYKVISCNALRENVVISNTGPTPIYLLGISANAADGWTFTNNCPDSLAPAQSCVVTVTAHLVGTGIGPGFVSLGQLVVLVNSVPVAQSAIAVVVNVSAIVSLQK